MPNAIDPIEAHINIAKFNQSAIVPILVDSSEVSNAPLSLGVAAAKSTRQPKNRCLRLSQKKPPR